VVALDRSLHQAAEQAFFKARAEAWQWFHDGRYRQAARAFETARSLEPSDAESRLGEIVCYFALGGSRSAMVALRQMPRAIQTPFAVDLKLAERFGRREEWRRVRVETQLLAEASSDPDVAALRSLLLWHFGERQEAAAIAAAIAKDHPASPFADWAVQMRSNSDAGGDAVPSP
jgi:thioredoxin-like negative regulator of GroEL